MRFTTVILSACFCLNAWAEGGDQDRRSDEELVQAAEQLTSNKGGREKSADAADILASESMEDGDSTAVGKTESTSKPEATAKSEAETPVFTKKNIEPKTHTSMAWRLAGSIALIALIGGATLFVTKKWSRQKNKGGDKVRIEVLHNFHMTPKRSLSLIRVAGEVMLIGCTDQSVNFLKSVSLIDDELEGILGKDFNNFLEDEFSIADVRSTNSIRA